LGGGGGGEGGERSKRDRKGKNRSPHLPLEKNPAKFLGGKDKKTEEKKKLVRRPLEDKNVQPRKGGGKSNRGRLGFIHILQEAKKTPSGWVLWGHRSDGVTRGLEQTRFRGV